MAEVMDKPVESQHQAAVRRFTSPNRILARSFRLSRDKWKQKHHQVQAKLEQTRQLAAERGIARDRWRERCEQATARAATAEASAARLQGELEQARTRIAALEAALQKNGLTPLDLDQNDPPARGSTPLSIIDVCRQLVVGAGVALRAVPRVLCIAWGDAGPNVSLPEASTVRWWLQRLGLFALREPLEQADDWVWIIDHSIQLGDTKVCVVLRLSQLPPPGQALRHEDVRTLAVLPVQSSTGEVVAKQLEEVSCRTGIPRKIVSDRGGDVKKGSELFAARHAGVALLSDAAHHGACLLKRRLEPDSRWPAFVARLGQTKASIQQTSDAHLLAPSLRPKARYMNLAPLLKWSRRVLELMGRGAAGGVGSVRAEARYGWLREYRMAIEEWSRCEATVRCSFVRAACTSAARGSCRRSFPRWRRKSTTRT